MQNYRIRKIYELVVGSSWCEELDPILAEKFAKAIIEEVISEVSNGELDSFELDLLREKFLN